MPARGLPRAVHYRTSGDRFCPLPPTNPARPAGGVTNCVTSGRRAWSAGAQALVASARQAGHPPFQFPPQQPGRQRSRQRAGAVDQLVQAQGLVAQDAQFKRQILALRRRLGAGGRRCRGLARPGDRILSALIDRTPSPRKRLS